MWTSQNESDSQTQQESFLESGDGDTAKKREALLSQVLTETLTRQREDPGVLVEAMREWSETLEDDSFCESLCQRLVGQVLRHRLGCCSHDVPAQMFDEIGAVLWSNSESRLRVKRLWESIRVRK